MLPEVEWLGMLIWVQIVGGLLIAAFMWSVRRDDDDDNN